MKIKPPGLPQLARQPAYVLAHKSWPYDMRDFPRLFVLGIRGYYQTTMGDPTRNDRNIYDDAIFIVSPTAFATFNANTDPSYSRSGVATLLPGWHLYRPGNHGISRPGGGYPAFRPATKGEALPVSRDGEAAVPSTRPGIAINIHKGSYTSTSSLGCQTIYPDQWQAFHSLLTLELSRHNLKTFHYCLINGPVN